MTFIPEELGQDGGLRPSDASQRLTRSERIRAALAEKRRFFASLSEAERVMLLRAGKAIRLGGPDQTLITSEQQERGRRTRSERAAAHAESVRLHLADLLGGGTTSLYALAKALTSAGVPTPTGKSTWSPGQVARTIERLGLGRMK